MFSSISDKYDKYKIDEIIDDHIKDMLSFC
jgi:hypothetical protein